MCNNNIKKSVTFLDFRLNLRYNTRMSERHFIEKLKSNISKYVVIEKTPQFAIDASYAFLPDNSADAWEKSIRDWEPEKRLSLRSTITQALKMDKYERLELIRDICETHGLVVKIGKEVKNKLNSEYSHIQAQINIYSMSDTNIQNLAAALEIEIEVD